MKEMGMNALLAVASGSREEPKFIILEYSGGKKNAAPVVLVGQGIDIRQWRNLPQTGG